MASKTLAALIIETSAILEDPLNAIFGSNTITQHLNNAVIEASRYVPAESKETVTMTAGNTEVTTSGIVGLRRIVKAEYPVDQTPRNFRNVTEFSGAATIETDIKPQAGDKVYLFCEEVHTLTSGASTLTPELEPIVVNLAAGNAALDNIGDGRTQIKAAVDAAALINTAVDSMTARLAQAVTDITAARNAIATDLSAAGTAITNAGNTITTAMATLASGKSTAANITADVTTAGVQVGLAITDVAAARAKLATAIAGFSSQLTDISTQISDSEDDLVAARALNDTIPTWATAETGLHSSASGGFGAASSRISEIKAILNDSTGISQESTLASSQLNIVSGLLDEIKTTLSANENKAGQYRTLGAAELAAANAYIGQARTLLLKISETVKIYIGTAAHELKTANGYFSEASGYMREASSRLSVANTQMQFTNWGRNKIQKAEADLRLLVKPHVFHTYPRT